jgi:hypothetical protein
MTRLLAPIFFLFVLLSCDEDNIDSAGCSTKATVRNLTGFDGCGYVFELEDGTRLEPVRVFYCGTPPLPKETMEDPLINFEFVDGKEVFISYELSTSPSICMTGPTVKITCIREVVTTAGL